MASPLHSSNHSAPSPSLTHASSADDADFFDRYLDTSAFASDEPAAAASTSTASALPALPAHSHGSEPQVHIADSSNHAADLNDPFGLDSDAFWSQYGQPSKDSDMSIDPQSLFEEGLPFGALPDSSASATNEPSPSDLQQPQQQLEPQQPADLAPSPSSAPSKSSSKRPPAKKTGATTTSPAAPSAGRRTRSSASKQQVHAHKSVADLALPMDESAEKPHLVRQQKPAAATTREGSAEEEEAANHHLPHIVFPVPDYIDRPSAEEYAKLSSKEKRQLRNKISARNFRHRRKEYITTLEEEIASRDSTIVTLEEEVTGLKTENTALRSDLDLLRKTVDELLNKARPASQPAPSASTSSSSNNNNVLAPNLHKDKSAFSTKSSFGPGGHNPLGSLDVHTLFMPTPSPAALVAQASAARKNMNPRLNHLLPAPEHTAHLPGHATDDSFFGSNPYLLKSDHLNQYRATLYGKLTHNLHGAANPAADFQPSYFSRPSSDPLKTYNSSSASTQTPAPLSPSLWRTDGEMEQEVHGAAEAQTARVAALASTSLVSTMFATFLNTFLGAQPAHLTDLLTGRAALRVVPAATSREASSSTPNAATSPQRRASIVELDDVERDLALLRVGDKKVCTKRS